MVVVSKSEAGQYKEEAHSHCAVVKKTSLKNWNFCGYIDVYVKYKNVNAAINLKIVTPSSLVRCC